jgi:gluconokinase
MVKLAWWSEHDPELLRTTARWGGVKELLLAALCGRSDVVDLSCASASGAYDLAGGRWDAEALEVAGVREEQLAEVVPTTYVLDGLRPDVARATGLPADLPVVVGASDGVLASLGTGAVRPNVGAVSLGTSGALRVVVPRPVVDPAGRLFCYALTDDHWVVGGAVNNGGSVVRWASLSLAASSDGAEPTGEEADELDARLLAEADQVAAGSDGLLCLPYLLGERAPWWRAGMRGAYIGLRREHRRPHLVRAAVEGVCQQLALVRDAFTSLDLPVDEVRATGGAVASPLWVRTLAATLDLPVRVADSPEGTGLGAVLLGMHALGPAARPRRGHPARRGARPRRAGPGGRRALPPAAPARRAVDPRAGRRLLRARRARTGDGRRPGGGLAARCVAAGRRPVEVLHRPP